MTTVENLNRSPIGIFDSGLGGLTLVRALKQLMPAERIVYLGDSARVPYGSKSSSTILSYARQAIDFLITTNAKYIVVACNSASANLPHHLISAYPLPIVGVIAVTARAAVTQTRSKHIGVLGTLATVRSKAYPDAIRGLDKSILCTQLACPLFVPLAEEGWVDKPVTLEIIREYLSTLADQAPDIDQLILGCTHYPLLKDSIEGEVKQLFSQQVTLVDSALESAKGIEKDLKSKKLNRTVLDPSINESDLVDRYVFTDASRFEELAQRFLGYVPKRVEYTDL